MESEQKDEAKKTDTVEKDEATKDISVESNESVKSDSQGRSHGAWGNTSPSKMSFAQILKQQSPHKGAST